MTDVLDAAFTPERALEVLLQLEPELRGVASDRRAIVGLKAVAEGHVELIDVALDPHGVLDPGEADGLVVVTSEEVGDEEEIVCLTQLVCVLPTGTEVGISRAAGVEEARIWRTDRDATDAAEELRPMDVAANTARRAYGLPSVVATLPSVAEIAGRAWLVAVAGEALARFDGPDGVREVEVEELGEVATRPLFGGLLAVDGAVPSWSELHAHAAAGHLDLGPFPVDGGHAAWLDEAGLAQVLDSTLPAAEDLLDQLRITSGDQGMAWAMSWLLERGWHGTE
ncbi:MAG: hypothetical protein ACLFUG_10140 [Nitriliruptoraceae bacterium]